MVFAERARRVSPLRGVAAAQAPLKSPIDGDVDHHDALHHGRVAVITGAADGIGLAAARAFARIGMKLAIADVNEAKLSDVVKELTKMIGAQNLISVVCDVGNADDVHRLRERVLDTWGEVSVLLNNAGISLPTGSASNYNNWESIMKVNFWGVVNVQHAFVPFMRGQENQSLIINTGSKQGITNPPGNPAYNVSKAAVKSLTESLALELRESPTKLTAHLFVPGWTHTALSSTSFSKPEGAWTPDETVSYLIDHLRQGSFYIICPDNEVNPEVDRLRALWNVGDMVEGRPALSRWHPDYKGEFEEFVREGLQQAAANAKEKNNGWVPPVLDHENR